MAEGELGKVYANDEIIFKEGDRGDEMFVIQSGRVKITKKTPTGDLLIATLEPGEIFGEMALFDKLSRSATAKADGETRVLSVDKKKLFTSISRDPMLVLNILESMSGRIRKLNEDLKGLRHQKLEAAKMYLDVDEACALILEKVKALVPAENGSVMLIDEESKALSIKSAYGSESDRKMKLSPGEGIAGNVLKTGRAEMINNVSTDGRFIEGDLRIQSIICVPLRWKYYNLGVLNLSNTSEKVLAIYAGIAIQNAKVSTNLQILTEKILIEVSALDIS
ncbi:MAG: cyclic nucleotide-binding domain-containing protein [Planctomycetota bacterium]|jgi:CRP-like cAMP-binding protein